MFLSVALVRFISFHFIFFFALLLGRSGAGQRCLRRPRAGHVRVRGPAPARRRVERGSHRGGDGGQQRRRCRRRLRFHSPIINIYRVPLFCRCRRGSYYILRIFHDIYTCLSSFSSSFPHVGWLTLEIFSFGRALYDRYTAVQI